MSFYRVHRRFITWLAALAMVLGAVAPAVAQTLIASSDRSDWVEVCSASGMMWVKVDAPDAGNKGIGTPLHASAKHCPWCSLHGGVSGLPPTALLVDSFASAPAPLPPYADLIAVSPAWSPTQARAPPFAA